eukprot:5667263-Lingulodinium_polyedra.AAC.1
MATRASAVHWRVPTSLLGPSTPSLLSGSSCGLDRWMQQAAPSTPASGNYSAGLAESWNQR